MKNIHEIKRFCERSHEIGHWGKPLNISRYDTLVGKIRKFIYRRPFYLFNFLKSNLKADLKVLDWGCGIGNLTISLSLNFNAATVGCDISEKATQDATKNAKRYKVNAHFVVADCCNLPFKDNSFDAVVSGDVFGHIYNGKQGITEISRILKHKD